MTARPTSCRPAATPSDPRAAQREVEEAAALGVPPGARGAAHWPHARRREAAGYGGVPLRADPGARLHDGHRGGRGRAQRHRHAHRGRRALRPRAAPPAARPRGPRVAPRHGVCGRQRFVADGKAAHARPGEHVGRLRARPVRPASAARGRHPGRPPVPARPPCATSTSPRDEDLLVSARQDSRAMLEADPMLAGLSLRPVRDEVIIRYGDVFKEVGGG